MADQSTASQDGTNGNEQQMPDPVAMGKAMADIAERSQRLVSDFLARQAQNGAPASFDPLNVGNAFLEMTAKMMADPAMVMRAQMTLWQDYMTLWQRTTQRMMGQEPDPVVLPDKGDRRFKDAAWDENALFDYIKQSYLLSARWMQSTVGEVNGLDDKTAKKVDFYTRQFVDAMAPSNFVMTNPEVLRTTLESGGENLVKGLDNLLGDLERGKGNLSIKMTDTEAFTVGENIATTPGKVVFQNDLMQLIQYTPTTEQVHKRPLLIIPPWINKFYILDLREKNSFIKWAVDRASRCSSSPGSTRTRRSPRRPSTTTCWKARWRPSTPSSRRPARSDANVIGYCLGGTLLSAYLGLHGGVKEDDPVQERHLLHHHDRLLRSRRTVGLHRRGAARRAGRRR